MPGVGELVFHAPAKPCWRQASKATTEAVLARFIDRRPGSMGKRTRSVTRGCFFSSLLKPTDSRPKSRMSLVS